MTLPLSPSLPLSSPPPLRRTHHLTISSSHHLTISPSHHLIISSSHHLIIFSPRPLRRTQLAILIFGGVLSGVFTLIPIYAAIYAGVQGYIGLCDAEGTTLPVNFEFLGNLIGAEPSYFAAIRSIDHNKFTTTMCGTAEVETGFAHMSFWLFVMLIGLFMHLPGIGGGWANLNKYTGLMTVIDNSLTDGMPVGKKTLV